ncbi:protein of unknown function [Chryseobacterium sp. JV274]|nr:protein of unknown function [Chryseobacterium sp. JV274]
MSFSLCSSRSVSLFWITCILRFESRTIALSRSSLKSGADCAQPKAGKAKKLNVKINKLFFMVYVYNKYNAKKDKIL